MTRSSGTSTAGNGVSPKALSLITNVTQLTHQIKVMGALEPDVAQPLELYILGEVLSTTQMRANQMVNLACVGLMSCIALTLGRCVIWALSLRGRNADGNSRRWLLRGSFASWLTPLETPLGQVCELNVYHIIPITDPLALFPINYHSISHPAQQLTARLVDVAQAPKAGRAPLLKPQPKATMTELVRAGKVSATLAELASIVRSKNVRRPRLFAVCDLVHRLTLGSTTTGGSLQTHV